LGISDEYQRRVYSHIDEIKESGKPVVIFGTGRAGWYIMKVLEHYDVPIASFSVNDPGNQNTYFEYPVLPPSDIVGKFPDARVFLGLFMPDTAAAIGEQFRQLNFQHVHYDMAAFLFTFFVAVAGRICDREILAKSIHILFENYKEGQIHYGLTRGNYFVSPFVTSVITQKCSLRCRDCAQLIPHYKAPTHFSVESVINDLRQYAKAFDVVPEISLHGGEPFLHPDIDAICREAAAIPNIVFISFVTNGTIILSEDKLQQLSACGADVHQSGGYGQLSKKRDELTEAFRSHGIYSDIMFCSPTEMWTQAPPYRKHARPAAANNEIYNNCVSSKTCCQIMKGELHRCALSMHGTHQGLFPECKDDFVRLHEPDMPDSVLTAKIRDFLNRHRALIVCDYCDPDGGTLVPPAIQLPRA
jgi:organic radical activating enzyme